MNINYFGLNTARLIDGGVSVLLFPEEATKESLRSQNDIILLAEENEALKKSNSFIISAAGEYEIKGVIVYAFNPEAEPDKLVYLVDIEGMKVVHLGFLTKDDFSENDLEKFENADILLLPVGGITGLNAKQAMKVVSELEPRVVIPVNYQTSNIKSKLNDLELFKKECGSELESTDKLKINKKDLPEEDTKFFAISPS